MNPKIQQIADLIPEIEESLNEINLYLPPDPQLGFMGGRGLKEALKAIVVEIKRLTHENHLVRYFTPPEIDQFHASLTQLNDAIPNYHLSNISLAINALSPLLRSYWSKNRNRNRTQAEIDQIQRCKEALGDLEEIKSKKEQISQQADNLQERGAVTKETPGKLKNPIAQLEVLKTTANRYLAQIADYKSSAKSETATVEANRATIDDFTGKIASREKDLENLKTDTDAYSETLEKLEALNEKRQAELTSMIEEARKALNLNTAIGLSREFQAKAESLRPQLGLTFFGEKLFRKIPKNNKTANFIGWWLLGSGAFVALALMFGFALMASEVDILGITLNSQNYAWHQILGRFSIVGLLVSAAVFCAKQYTRNGRLLEEYAYKKVISATLPSFLQQLEGQEITTTSLKSKYLIRAIEELHQHPLEFLNSSKNKSNKSGDFQMKEFSKMQEEILSRLEKIDNS